MKFLNIAFLLLFIACQKSEDTILIPDPLPDVEIEVEPDPETTPETEKILSEIVLQAKGTGNTYELINSVFAPGYNVVEVPDCNHEDFGRHIDEVFDNELNKYVFRFHIHTTPDNDRCINFDRQRNEIKSYDKSPDELKGLQDEKVEYAWKFKIPSGFQSSNKFTHIHQIKAVGGTEDAMPLITLTTRKGAPDKLELRYSETTSQITLKEIDLTPIKGKWVAVVETVIFGEKGVGNYDIKIIDYESKNTLFSYTNNTIRMWKTNADFMRPKWGIYRSLLSVDDLRDEEVLFADFSVKEIEN